MPIPPELLTFARELRKNQTDAENLLWMVVRGRRFDGFKFRRQQPLGGYILDFYCHEALLAIELDGGGHAEDQQIEYDRVRSEVLASAGVDVLRFWNHDVLQNTESVLEVIWSHLHQAVSPSSGLRPPSPSREKE